MKERVLTGLIGGLLVLISYLLCNTIYLNIAIALLSIIAVFEIQNVFKMLSNRYLMLLNAAFAAFIPFSFLDSTRVLTVSAVVIYIIVLFVIVEINKKPQLLTRIISVSAVSLIVIFALNCVYFIRDLGKTGVMDLVPEDRLLLITFALGAGWISDIGAYFVGVFFGKHKLCPNISPKKTVEGAVGGVLFWVLIASVAAYLHSLTVPVEIARINYPALIVVSVIGSVLSIVGDLFASCIKRANGVKDFGNLFPGHGGVMDRFDSIVATAPYYYIILQIVHIIVRY